VLLRAIKAITGSFSCGYGCYNG